MRDLTMDIDSAVRIAAFKWLIEQTSLSGDVLPRNLLQEGFLFEGQRVPLVSPQGIFKPRIMEFPLSITTTPEGPYDDSLNNDDFLIYRYRGTDPNHRDNLGLRRAFQKNSPLVYFHGIFRSQYLAVWPVYIVGDDPAGLSFKVAVEDKMNLNIDEAVPTILEGSEGRRAYLTAVVKQRLHQRSFRESVLQAYHTTCAFCRLRHRELLDAAHIIPDNEPVSKPTVNNGIALCKLHHAAFDSFMIGVTPDYLIQVRQNILDEEDGPILKHGLKEMHNSTLILPNLKKYWPEKEYLAWRYDKYKKAV